MSDSMMSYHITILYRQMKKYEVRDHAHRYTNSRLCKNKILGVDACSAYMVARCVAHQNSFYL